MNNSKNEEIAYNAKVIGYEDEIHVTCYMNTITRNKHKMEKGNGNFRRDYVNAERTEKEIEHCITQSLRRTKNSIYHIARSNKWDWFITLTFNRSVVDSSSYENVVKTLMIFLSNIKARKCPDLIYLIVPEFHADGKHYHFHGLLANAHGMDFVDSGHCTSAGETIYNIGNWTYGFTTATKVKCMNKVSGYITKYITKQTCQVLKNKKRYYVSKNAHRAEELYCVLNREQVLKEEVQNIKYLKTVNVPCAHQMLTYIEVDRTWENTCEFPNGTSWRYC